MSKPHSWTMEEVDGGPIGTGLFWECAVCGAAGGPVRQDERTPDYCFAPGFGYAATLPIDDCEEAARLFTELKAHDV